MAQFERREIAIMFFSLCPSEEQYQTLKELYSSSKSKEKKMGNPRRTLKLVLFLVFSLCLVYFCDLVQISQLKILGREKC